MFIAARASFEKPTPLNLAKSVLKAQLFFAASKVLLRLYWEFQKPPIGTQAAFFLE